MSLDVMIPDVIQGVHTHTPLEWSEVRGKLGELTIRDSHFFKVGENLNTSLLVCFFYIYLICNLFVYFYFILARYDTLMFSDVMTAWAPSSTCKLFRWTKSPAIFIFFKLCFIKVLTLTKNQDWPI